MRFATADSIEAYREFCQCVRRETRIINARPAATNHCVDILNAFFRERWRLEETPRLDAGGVPPVFRAAESLVDALATAADRYREILPVSVSEAIHEFEERVAYAFRSYPRPLRHPASSPGWHSTPHFELILAAIHLGRALEAGFGWGAWLNLAPGTGRRVGGAISMAWSMSNREVPDATYPPSDAEDPLRQEMSKWIEELAGERRSS